MHDGSTRSVADRRVPAHLATPGACRRRTADGLRDIGQQTLTLLGVVSTQGKSLLMGVHAPQRASFDKVAGR